MVESVDTRDLKSLALWVCEFKSRSGHQIYKKSSFLAAFFMPEINTSAVKQHYWKNNNKYFPNNVG
jgi:hypothetical protein